jgi:Uma2 family endonuclease
MTLTSANPRAADSLGDLLDRLGEISPFRIRMRPAPGTATEADVVAIMASENRLFELIDGTLVEKGMGYRESVLALAIASALRAFVIPRKLGLVSGPDGMMRLFPQLVRSPDVAFVTRARLPDGHMPKEAIPDLVPDLAVEVLSESNTPREMFRKRQDYFRAGVRLVWVFDPDARTVDVFTAPENPSTLAEQDVLEGGTVLAGFAVPLSDLFADLDL